MPRPAPVLSAGRSILHAASLLALLLLPSALTGQDLSAIGLRLPGSTRAMATAGAFPLGQRDSDAIFYNPAFGDAMRGLGGAVQAFGREGTLITASAGLDWWRGSVAVGVRSLTGGYATALPGGTAITESTLRAGGLFAGAEQILSVAYAQRVRGIRFGATGHLVQQRRDAFRAETFAVDVAAAHELLPVRIGLAARSIGPALSLGGTDLPLPASLALQAATLAAPVGPLDIALAGVIEQRLDAAGGTSGGLGAEISWWPIAGRTFSARIGGRSAPAGEGRLTLGGGFTGDRIALDYAWRALDGGATHRVGVRWR